MHMASSNCMASTACMSQAQAQQEAAEWEQLANKDNTALKEAQAVHDQVEDCATQLEVKHLHVWMQLDKKDAEEHLAKV